MRNACTVLFGEPDRTGLLQSFERRWKGNNKMDFSVAACGRLDLVHGTVDVAQCVAFVSTEIGAEYFCRWLKLSDF
jgi:hypothetical protein